MNYQTTVNMLELLGYTIITFFLGKAAILESGSKIEKFLGGVGLVIVGYFVVTHSR